MQILKRFLRWVNLPYTNRPVYRQVEWGLSSNNAGAWSITDVPHDIGAGALYVTLPTWTGTVISAFIDLHMGTVENYAPGANALNGTQYIQVRKAAGTWTDAITIPDEAFTLSPAHTATIGRYYGDKDIATVVQSIGGGGNMYWRWHNALALDDGMAISGGIQLILRVIFR